MGTSAHNSQLTAAAAFGGAVPSKAAAAAAAVALPVLARIPLAQVSVRVIERPGAWK